MIHDRMNPIKVTVLDKQPHVLCEPVEARNYSIQALTLLYSYLDHISLPALFVEYVFLITDTRAACRRVLKRVISSSNSSHRKISDARA